MIRFKSCRWKNFLSYGDEITEFDFTLDGITVITGENGVGKSTILEVLAFALFGKTFRESIKAEIINDRNGKDCMVEVDFEVDNGSLITITRTLKPDNIVVREGDKTLNKESSTKETQIMINEILNMNFFLFRQLVVQSKTQFLPFLEFKAQERRDFIDKIFNLDVYRSMDKKNKENIKTAQKKKDDLEKDISHLESIIQTNQSFLDDTLRRDATAEEDAEREFNAQVDKMKADLDGIVEEGRHHKSVLDSMGGILNFKDKSDLMISANALKNSQYTAKRDGDDSSKMAHFFENNDVCPTCTQMIKPQWKGSKIAELSKKVEESKVEWTRLSTELAIVESEISEIDMFNRDVSAKNERYANTERMVKTFRDKFVSAKKQLDQFISNGVKINDTKNTIESLKLKIKNSTEELQTKKGELSLVNENLVTYTNSALVLKDDGIIATIINEYVPELNNYVNKYLGMMGIDMVFELSKTFEDTFYKSYGKKTSYRNLSEGQKLRVNMAVVLAWRDIVALLGMNTTDIIFFDETFDSSFDPKGVSAFLDILYGLDDMGVFIITHTPEKVDADNVYNVVGENGFSKIVTGN